MTAHARTRRQPTLVDEAADQLRSMLADLTRTRSHRERITAQVGHTSVAHSHFTKVPPLLMQLQWADWTKGTERSGSGFESRPAASIEALVTLTTIDLEAARWVRDLGEDDPGSTIGCVLKLGGLLPSAHRCARPRGHEHDGKCHDGRAELERGRSGWCCTWHAVEHDVRRWWTQARIITGWESPAWRPDNTCPACGERRSLRIRLADRVGFCVECRETWPPDSYQVLAEHIRVESEVDRLGSRVVAGACWCPWPAPSTNTGLAMLCPRCGHASCVHAVRSTGRKATS